MYFRYYFQAVCVQAGILLSIGRAHQHGHDLRAINALGRRHIAEADKGEYIRLGRHRRRLRRRHGTDRRHRVLVERIAAREAVPAEGDVKLVRSREVQDSVGELGRRREQEVEAARYAVDTHAHVAHPLLVAAYKLIYDIAALSQLRHVIAEDCEMRTGRIVR